MNGKSHFTSKSGQSSALWLQQNVFYQTKATFAKHIILQLANNDGTQTADTIAKSPGMMLCPTRNNSANDKEKRSNHYYVLNFFFRIHAPLQFLEDFRNNINRFGRFFNCTALDYKPPRILGPRIAEFPCLVHKLSVILTALQHKPH